MSCYRVAIIGTGGIAGAHARALGEMGDRVHVVAAADIDRARLEQYCVAHGIPHAYTDARDMLATEHADLVHIATPPGTHYDLIMACLDAGAWVLCEKPLCLSLAELDRIIEVEKRTGRYCSSVFQWRFGSGARHLKQLMAEEVLGRPLVGICQTVWYRDHAYFQVPWRGRWATEGGGPTMGHGIHAMDLFLWLLGEWQEVGALAETLDRAIEVEDVSLAIVRFAGGTLGSIVNSLLSPRQETYLRLDFQRATVELRALYGYTNADWRCSLPEGVQDESVQARWRDIPHDEPAGHAAQLRALLDSMDRGERPPASALDVRPTFEFITCLYKAAVLSQTIRRGSIGRDDPFYQHVAGRLTPSVTDR